jgi:hypothetical protein
MRPALQCDDVKDLDIAGLMGGAPGNEQPLVRLIGTKRAFVHGCLAPPGTTTFLRVEGGQTEKVTLLGNDLSETAGAVTKDADVPADAVFESGNRMPKG